MKGESQFEQNPNRGRQQTDPHAGRAFEQNPCRGEKKGNNIVCKTLSTEQKAAAIYSHGTKLKGG